MELTDTQRQLRDTVRAFAAERVKPNAGAIDREERFPGELVAELGRMGVLGCLVPERWGGAGFDHVACALAIEELTAACATTGAICSAHAVAVWSILTLGTDAQRERWLPRLASGECLGCLALDDVGPSHTSARRDGADVVLAGRKGSIVNGRAAGLAIVVASAGGRGHTAIVVETERPGWQVVRVEERTGARGTQAAEVALADVRVPAGNVLGGEGGGFAVVEQIRAAERVGVAAQAVGIARAALEASLAYAGERRAFGQRLADFQHTQFRLADMASQVEAARLLTLRAAFLLDRGDDARSAAAMAKLHAADSAITLATQAVQIHGGYGYTCEFPVERHFRDAAVAQVAAGTADVQRLAIAADLVPEEGPT